VQARFSTSLQLRLNHFSACERLVKRSASAAGASGRIGLLVFAKTGNETGAARRPFFLPRCRLSLEAVCGKAL